MYAPTRADEAPVALEKAHLPTIDALPIATNAKTTAAQLPRATGHASRTSTRH